MQLNDALNWVDEFSPIFSPAQIVKYCTGVFLTFLPSAVPCSLGNPSVFRDWTSVAYRWDKAFRTYEINTKEVM